MMVGPDEQRTARFRKTARLAAALCLLATGCRLGPDYVRPNVIADPEATWEADPYVKTNAAAALATTWWRQFKDPWLDQLMETAFKNNLDLQESEARLEAVRAAAGLAAAGDFPTLSAQGSAQRQSSSLNGALPLEKFGAPRRTNTFQTGLSTAWEIDLFGRRSRQKEAAGAQAAGADERRRATALFLSATVAQNYIQLRTWQKRLQLARRNRDLRTQAFNIMQQYHNIGAGDRLELARANARRLTAEARIPALEAQIRAIIQRLGTLSGQTSADVWANLHAFRPLSLPADSVPVGLKSEIVQRRPDILEAEHILEAQTADIGIAKAQWFPHFSLVGNLGFEATTFGDLLDGRSGQNGFGGILSWPLFSGGAIAANIKTQTAEARAASLHYEKIVREALGEVETALVFYGESLETRRRLEQAARIARRTFVLTRQRYRQGLDNILAAMEAETEFVSLRDQLTEADGRTLDNLVVLYKALGGGWEIPAASVPEA